MTSWHNKVLRDLQQNKLRSVLVVVAIAIGIAGFGAVLSTYSILTRELNTGYLASNPASATIWVNKIDDVIRKDLMSFDGVKDFEERRMITARIKAGTSWKNAQLFVIPDFNRIRISRLTHESGNWPPRAGEVLIERDALGVAQARVGEAVEIQTTGGSELSLRVAGVVHDVGQAQARMEQIVYGYIPVETLTELGEERYLDQFKMEVAGDKSNEQHVRATISRLKQYLESKGHVIKRVEVPKPGAHPHADLMGTLLIYKSSFGFFALILSGVLVLSLLSAIMAGQVRQIGIMKAIGATTMQIRLIYYSLVVLFSIASLVVAIPASILGGRWLSSFMARFLNFDLQSYSISWWVYALQMLAGIIVPLVAASYPVHRGSRITVLEAITDYGIAPHQFGNGYFDRIIAKAAGVTRPFLLSIRNTFRRRGRLVLILGTLALGGTIFIAAWNVRASLIHTVDVVMGSFRYDLALNFADYYEDAELIQVIHRTDGINHVELWSSAEASVIGGEANAGNSTLQLVAVSVPTSMLVLDVMEGRSFTASDTNPIVINHRLAANRPDLRPGRTVRLRIGDITTSWQVIGIARQPLAGPAAYTSHHVFTKVTSTEGRSKNARIVTTNNSPLSMDQVRRALEGNLKSRNLRLTSSVSMADRRRVIDEHNSVIYIFLIVMALLLVLVGGLGLMTIMSINVLERRREIGVLRTIGATRRRLLLILLGEGALIGALSWFLALPLSYLISVPLGNFAAGRILQTELSSATDPTGAILWLVIVFLFGAAASYLPALNATRTTIRELIDYE